MARTPNGVEELRKRMNELIAGLPETQEELADLIEGEAGETLLPEIMESINPGDSRYLRNDTKSERVSVRLSPDEVECLDAKCNELGIGRSTFLRMAARKELGIARDTSDEASLEQAAAKESA